ncbi:MAG: phosphatase PAP2 family protein [Archangiaceae bacterium]|nr:phosphatase PAP2 family protein [Archangiaceae bacterium]
MSDRPISFGARLMVAAAASSVNAVLYLVPNHVQLKAPALLPWTPVDAAVPFVPLTLWIYFSDYLLVASAFLLVRTWGEATRFARAYFALLVVGSAVHLAWPTVFPRESFPLSGDGLTVRAFALLRQVDLPTSCLPSMHVAGSYLAAFSLWRRSRATFTVWTSWATAVAVSTLTAKQHYAVDVVAGLMMAAVFWALFFARPGREPQRSGLAAASSRRWSSSSSSQ